MDTYDAEQEYKDLRWGTMTPIAVRVGSRIVQLRARGTCSVRVRDVQALQEQIPDPASLPGFVRNVLAGTLADVLAELSLTASDTAQLTTASEATLQALRANIEPKFNSV